jgi:hypothetical protein
MNQNEAFTDKPPIIEGVSMRYYDGVVQNTIKNYVARLDNAIEATYIGAYVIISTMGGREALEILTGKDAVITCDARALDLPKKDFDAINDYLCRVLDRRAAASIEIPESPGKPEESEATQPTK